jgi:hypothetical protein
LKYSINVTPNLLYNILNSDIYNDNFDACCSCCAAFVNYEYNIKKRKKELKSVTLFDNYYDPEPNEYSNAFEIVLKNT